MEIGVVELRVPVNVVPDEGITERNPVFVPTKPLKEAGWAKLVLLMLLAWFEL